MEKNNEYLTEIKPDEEEHVPEGVEESTGCEGDDFITAEDVEGRSEPVYREDIEEIAFSKRGEISKLVEHRDKTLRKDNAEIERLQREVETLLTAAENFPERPEKQPGFDFGEDSKHTNIEDGMEGEIDRLEEEDATSEIGDEGEVIADSKYSDGTGEEMEEVDQIEEASRRG